MIESVQPNLFVFYSPNQGSNAFLLVGKKIVLIDASSENNSTELLSEIKKVGFEAEDIDVVLFTHGHADHFSGALPFKGAELKMCKRDANYVNGRDPMYTVSSLFESEHFPKITSFVSGNDLLKFSPFKLRVLQTPGHTQGSVCFFEQDQKLLFSGDTLFNQGVGRFDLPSGNKGFLVKSLKMLNGLEFDTLLPGHGLVVREKQAENINFALKSLSGSFI